MIAEVQSLNLVVLIGHVSSEVQFDQGKGKDKNFSIAKFSIATNEKFGASKSSVQYHNLIMWGPKRAEFCKKHIKKGQLLCIKGKLKHKGWKDKEGNHRKTTQVYIDVITFLGKKEDYADVPKEEGPTPETEVRKDPF